MLSRYCLRCCWRSLFSMASDIERVCLTWDISCYLSRNIKGTLDLFCNFTFLSQRLAVYIASAIGSTPIGTMHK